MSTFLSSAAARRHGYRRARRLLAAAPVAAALIGMQAVAAPAAVVPPGGPERVVGGQAVADGRYPFQAALLVPDFGTDDRSRQFCGGSLISERLVLTAAHCASFLGDQPGRLPLEKVRVVLGRTVLTSTQGVVRGVVRVQVHPRFDAPVPFAHDVAVLTLDRPVTGIRPVRYVDAGATALERPGTQATVTGWGATSPRPPLGTVAERPDRLRAATVPLVRRGACAASYASATPSAVVDAGMLCAGSSGHDTCQGDSGGPLFVPAAAGGYLQLGVTSWGYGCAADGFPGVYARLSDPAVAAFLRRVTGGGPAARPQAGAPALR